MKIVADLHLHSKYSRAVSQQMTFPIMAQWASFKGIDLLGTGDFTHPLWFREIKELFEEEEGIFRLRQEFSKVRFLLTTEISCIYSQGGRVRKIHSLIIVPSLAVAEKINQELIKRGANLMADGRPIIGLSAKDLLDLVMMVDENNLLIPAHIWTPHFSLFGSESGFDSLEECFGDLSSLVYAIETGLSSDPAMNWRIFDLSNRQIVSFSDAHSPENLGRETTVLEVDELNYKNIRSALTGGNQRILSTIEFYPEEGKYHFTGHRVCGVSQSPQETKKRGTTCPVCGKALTVGVLHRVEELAKVAVETTTSIDEFGVRWLATSGRPNYTTLVPLREILAEVEGVKKDSQKVNGIYQQLIEKLGNELEILLRTSIERIIGIGGERVGEAINKVRRGQVFIKPGFDGEYGIVKIWAEELNEHEGQKEQMTLF